MKIPFRPITRVQEMLKAIGLEVSYSYDDLIFPTHNAYLLQMGAKGQDLFVHFNEESPEPERPGMLSKLKTAGAMQGLKVRFCGLYAMKETEEKELQIQFIPPQ